MEAVVELTDSAVPLQVSDAGIAVIERLELSWPRVTVHPRDLDVLVAETPGLRHALLDRLAEEADPPARLFHILPWELVERLAEDLLNAIGGDGRSSDVRLMHWFTPTGSRFSNAMDQMNMKLRESGPSSLADHGGAALCERLAEADLARFPDGARAALAALTRRLPALDPTLRELSREATRRLAPGPVQATVSADAARITADWLRGLPEIGPGDNTAETGGVRMHLTVIPGEHETGRLTLEVDPPVDDLAVLVRMDQDRVTYLGHLADGRMDLELDYPSPYELRPAARRRGTRHEAVEVFTFEPHREVALASDRDVRRVEQVIVVPRLDLQVSAYESSSGQLIISASAGSPDAAGHWIELVLHDLDDASVQECVIPLHWVYDAAEGALSVGVWRDRLAIGLRLELIGDPAELDPAAVRWSVDRAADERTRADLRALLASSGEDDAP
jgi:hypothetical protein